MSGERDMWTIMRSGAAAAAENMAIDEALLLSARFREDPVLRFYSWRSEAASFGYFQRYVEIEQATSLRPLIRRPTGGGLVPHARDWTYSIVVPPTHEWFALRAEESYCRVHRWVVGALDRLGVKATLASRGRDGQGRCFAGFEKNDVLFGGGKIAGAAQRRKREGLLIQGSVQHGESWDRGAWENAMLAYAEEEFGVRFAVETAPLVEPAVVDRLIAEKYESENYLRQR